MSSKEFLTENILVKPKDYTPDAKTEVYLKELRRETTTKPVIFIGAGTCGLGAGAAKTLEAAKNFIENNKIEAKIIEVGCIGLCSAEPIMDVQIPGFNRISFHNVIESKVDDILSKVFQLESVSEDALCQFPSEKNNAWENIIDYDKHPFFGPQTRFVLKNCGIIDPISIEEYIANGGYKSYLDVLRTYKPAEICDMIEKSGLRGRGGGGFPTGKKWKFAANTKADQRYLICNADEGDPGAFMDRAVIEGDPHRLIEGMAIAAYGIGATKAYIYIRAEYPLAIKRLNIALEQAEAYGLLGHNIFGSAVDFQIKVKMGAGAFVCGEETALIHSIEGRRGMPRPRPPFPAVNGLFQKPTIINNVETLSNIPEIMLRGVDYFASIGTKTSKGTKVFALSVKIE